MHYRTLFFAFALALLLQNSLAASSNIDINIAKNTLYLKAPANLTLKFNFTNLRDDDSTIDRVDFYILDLKSKNVNFIAFSGTGWQHEYLAKFDDDHFWITNASGQSLDVVIKPNFDAEGTYELQAYYQFFDQTGSMVGLGDNRPVQPLNDVIDHIFARIIVDKTPPVVTLETPVWVTKGLSITAAIADANPIYSAKLAYNSPTGQKTITATYSKTTGKATAVIPLANIKEGTLLNYTMSATDAANNTGSASGSFMAKDNPQISQAHPDSLLPQSPVNLFASITDSSGVASAEFLFSQNGSGEKTVQMIKGANDIWSAELGSFSKGTKIDGTITAKDTLGNPGTAIVSFTILNEYSIKFNVIDSVLKTPLKNVTLAVSSRNVTSYGSNFVIPEKTFTFDYNKTFSQFEGKYYFTFSQSQYPNHVFLFDIQSDMEKTIMLGSGLQSRITNAEINPRISDDNQSFYLDITALIQEAYPVKQVNLIYSINSDAFDSNLSLSKNSLGQYFGVLGPFENQIVLYSRIELSDASEQVAVYDLGIRWYSLLSALGGQVNVEICGNGKDDNNNGVIDEGCPCKENDVQTCSKNVGICKTGQQKCLDGKWSEFCDGGITPVPEACGNELDDDCDNIVDNGCFVDSDLDGLSDSREEKIGTDPRNPDTDEDNVSDGQEVLYDSTDPLDPKSNLLYIDLKANIVFGNSQSMLLVHPKLGAIKGIEALIVTPDGEEIRLSANSEGAVIFKPTVEGSFSAKVSKKKFEAVKGFTVNSGLFSIVGSGLGNSISYVFGESSTQSPLEIILVIILCVACGFTVNFQYNSIMRPKKILSSSEERKELIKRTGFVVIAGAMPLIAFRLAGIIGAIIVAVFIIIVFFTASFTLAKLFGGKKAVRVDSERQESDFFSKIASKIKGLLVEEKKTADIKQTTGWKKIDWELDKNPAEERLQGKASGQPEIEAISAKEKEESEKGFEYITPETAGKFEAGQESRGPSFESSRFEPSRQDSTKSVEVWKRFEPVEFEERMTEIGKEVEKSLEKKLLEVGDEIESRIGKKLAEVEEEVDKRVSRRLLETEEQVERRLSRKLSEIEEDVDRKMKGRMEEMESEVGKEVEKKIEAERVRRVQKKTEIKKLKRQFLLRKIANEELRKAEFLKSQNAELKGSAASASTGFVLKEKKEPSSLALVQKTEELQAFSKTSDQKMQDLTRQLAVLNQSFEKGLVSKEEFEKQSSKIKEELKKI